MSAFSAAAPCWSENVLKSTVRCRAGRVCAVAGRLGLFARPVVILQAAVAVQADMDVVRVVDPVEQWILRQDLLDFLAQFKRGQLQQPDGLL